MKLLKTIMLSATIFATSAAWAEKEIDQTLEVSEGGEVIIDIISGDVRIGAWDKNEVRVVGDVGDQPDGLIFKTSGKETYIKMGRKKDSFFGKHYHNHNDDVDLMIYVPSDSMVRAEGASTDFQIAGIKGGVSVQSMSGDFELTDLGRKIQAQSMSGDVEISNSTAKIFIETVSGDIQVDVSAIEFDVSTVSGDIEASIGESERVELASVSGEINIRCGLVRDSRVDIETVSGDIDLSFLEDKVNAQFDLETGPGGEIRNSLSEDQADRSFIGSERMRFKSGNGAASVNIDTMSGTIKINN